MYLFYLFIYNVFHFRSSSGIQFQISEHFFYSTAMACVQYFKDCDKVRANSVRALGIFLYHLQHELISKFFHCFIF